MSQIPSADEPQRSAAPAMPRRVSKLALLIVSYVLLAAVAASVGYVLGNPLKKNTVLSQAETVGPAASPAPAPAEVTAPVSEATPERDSSADTLKIIWNKPTATSEEHFFDQRSAFDQNAMAKVFYWQVGRVEGDGPYKGYTLFDVNVDCEGPCFSMPTYRLLAKYGDSRPFLLARYSPKDLSYVQGNFTVLENIVVPEFEFPKIIKGPQGQVLEFGSWEDRWFDLSYRRFAFRDDQVGEVFVDVDSPPREAFAVNGFYVHVADGTEVRYRLPFPFMKDTIPDVVWSDGTKNASDYVATDVTGCGSSNLASVLDASSVSRTDDLVAVGKASNGDTVYGFRDPKRQVLQDIYGSIAPSAEDGAERTKMPYDEYAASHPVFVWIDPFGRMIKFQKAEFLPAAECGKPVIYLYPEKTMDVSVRLAPQGGFTKSEPAYDGGWNVRATPAGQLTDLKTGKSHPYLFWEGRGGLYETPKRGFVVAGNDVHAFLTEKLARLGLNEKESADFLEFWEPRMTGAPYFFVTFLGNREMDALAPLTVTPKPDSVIRLLMDFQPLTEPIAVQEYDIRTPARVGFTVVEWGGVLR